jgi:hypothetical protein
LQVTCQSENAKTDASLRIDLGGLSAPPVKEPDIAPRLLLDNVDQTAMLAGIPGNTKILVIAGNLPV